MRAILEKRSITRSIGRDDELNECGISSLDMVNLMLAVEAEFDVKIPDRDMTPANFRSVARIEALVEKLQTRRVNSSFSKLVPGMLLASASLQ